MRIDRRMSVGPCRCNCGSWCFFSCGGICVGGVTTTAKITKIQIGSETNDERG